MIKIKKHKIYLTLSIIIGLFIFVYFQNNSIVVNHINYFNSNLPSDFDGFKILQVSDLHNKDFNNKLIEKTKQINPDIIVVTGDLIDSRNTDVDIALKYIKQAIEIAPIYYVSGNHEQRSGKYEELIKLLNENKVIVLENKIEQIVINNKKDNTINYQDNLPEQNFFILGVSDFSFFNDDISAYQAQITKGDGFNLLLAHRPELFDSYVSSEVDLVLTGHAHGGQIRLPFIGGLFAPGQGFFPKYTKGIYQKENTSMIVSRGLGNSLFPIRVFNRPELVVINLYVK